MTDARRRRAPRALDILVAIVAICLAALIAYPLPRLLWRTFVEDGSPTLSPFRKAFSLPGIGETIANTVVVLSIATMLATMLACLFAWLNERTDARLRLIADIMPLTPFLVPAIAGTIGWLFLLSPRAGIINVAIRDVTAKVGITITDGPIDLFSRGGLIFLYVLTLLPFVYLPISAALIRLDPAIEEASRVAGVGPWRTFFKVTIPAVKPAVASGMLVAVVMGLATFTVPVIIGTSAGIDILSVRIYNLLTVSYPPDIPSAVALSSVLLVIIAGVSTVQRRIVRSGAYATVGGKGTRADLVQLSTLSRRLARTAMITFFLLACVLPLLALIYVSLRGFWTPSISLDGLSLRNYDLVFNQRPVTRSAFLNSVTLAAATAVIGMALMTLLALYTGAARRGAGIVDGLAKAPGTLSHLVLAVAFLTAFAGSPFNLGGTLILLLLAYVLLSTPQAYLSASSAFTQLSPQLAEASATSGGSPGRTLRRITLPLMAP
ncbi:MAG: ABC transporter permease subunit, partial [Mycetocola sp.]